MKKVAKDKKTMMAIIIACVVLCTILLFIFVSQFIVVSRTEVVIDECASPCEGTDMEVCMDVCVPKTEIKERTLFDMMFRN